MGRAVAIMVMLAGCEFGSNAPGWSYTCDTASCGDNASGSTSGENYLHCQYDTVNPKGYGFCELYSITFTAYSGCWSVQHESCYEE